MGKGKGLQLMGLCSPVSFRARSRVDDRAAREVRAKAL